MGMAAIPLIGAGAGLLGSLFKNKPQEYRQTPFQSQYGNYLMGGLGGQQTMNPQQLAQWQQAYAVPQQAQWAMNILPQMFGGMGGGGFGGFGMPQTGVSLPQQQMPMQGMPQQMPQSVGWGGQGGGGFGMNPFAMPWAR